MYRSRCRALRLEQARDLLVPLRLQVAEREVLQLPLDLPDAEAVGERRVDLHRLVRDADAASQAACASSVRMLCSRSASLMMTTRDVLRHRQEHLAQAFRLDRLVARTLAGRAPRDPRRAWWRRRRVWRPRRRTCASASRWGRAQSSCTSWSRAAAIVAASSWSSATVSAASSGWTIYGSPVRRFWPSCASDANSYASSMRRRLSAGR